MRENDLPEGVIDADPAGGWESEDVADATTEDQSREAQGSPRLAESGLPLNAPDGADATADAPASPAAPAGPIEGDEASRGSDPDMIEDADLDQGRPAEGATDEESV